MKKEFKGNSSSAQLLLDRIENKYGFIVKAATHIKELQKKEGKEKTREEIFEKAIQELLSNRKNF